ncbi:MAG TPA: GGDEF domain-containing protein, partial [Spirochaetia bacterium]|nr:GGDEF domain-containing protein [Spirochaetia bacterium]
YNRQMFREVFNKELSGRVRYKRALSLIMFDIDHFKHVNDTHGHATGDYVLKEVCSLVRQNLRGSDYFVRWGGEEFLILLTDTDRQNACKVAESLRSKLASHNFERAGRVTCSFGVCEIDGGGNTMDQVIERADELLYKAKSQGRNRVES